MAFIRAFNLVIAPAPVNGVIAPGGIDVSQLRCTFIVKKDLQPKPNHAEIKVWNLCPDNQRFLESPKALSVRLEGGYEDEGIGQLYLGETFSAWTRVEETNDVTKISTDDKGRKHQTAQIHIPVGPGASVESCITNIIAALNLQKYGPPIGLGNLKQGFLTWSIHPRGGVLSGFAASVMTDLCQSAGLEWSIQDGDLYIVKADFATDYRSFVLSSSTGLIGSPVVDNEGVVVAETLLNARLKPGMVVDFDAKNLKGGYRITKLEHRGDTHGEDWHTKFWGTKF